MGSTNKSDVGFCSVEGSESVRRPKSNKKFECKHQTLIKPFKKIIDENLGRLF